ncbi:S-type pyocin domain-containing protein [Pragia fontium]|uniref:S-type pyocin domain-containing protein n=1 Tax=Pragia fontium TaxID=82985 RepID=UPI000F6BFF91|nr:S-type pyocin domain-containing protein [Pragia fontium]VEJ54615.1 Colicin-D [Pragia fontium]
MSKESRTLSSRDEEPIINYLGEGKFKFKSQDAACYMHPLGWVADNNRGGISLCFTTEEENCLALFKLTGVQPVPVYTPEMATASSNALKAAGIMALSRAPGAIQFSIAGSGVLTPVTQVASAVSGAIARALAALAATATASTAGPIAAAVVMGMWPSEAGQGSDKWNGQNLALLSLPLTTLSGKQTVLPGRPTIDLPARGSLMMNGNQLEFKLLKTGGALSKAVPVLNAVRDAVTGLDSIIIPAMGGVPERTILINPAPTGPMFPPHTGNSSPKPVTPVHTGTTIETIDKPLILTTPVPDETFDFIYWQLDAKGSGVEPVYVVVSSPPKSVVHKHKHYPPKGVPWQDIVKSTANGGAAKFKPGVNIPQTDIDVWLNGVKTIKHPTWKVKEYDYIIGAYDGKETQWVVVKESQGTIHSHPTSLDEVKRYMKNVN